MLDETYFWGKLSLPLAEVGASYGGGVGSNTERLMVTSAEKTLSELINSFEFDGLSYLFGGDFAESYIMGFENIQLPSGIDRDEFTSDVRNIIYGVSEIGGLPLSPVANYVFLMIENYTKTKRMQKAVVQNLVLNTNPIDNKLFSTRVINEMVYMTIRDMEKIVAYFDSKGIDYSIAERFSSVRILNNFPTKNKINSLFL